MTTSNAVRSASPTRDKAAGDVGERGEIVGQEQPRRLVYRLDERGNRRLASHLNEMVAMAGRSASPLEAQFRLRVAGRRAALDVFGRSLLGTARAHLKDGNLVQYENLPSTEEEDTNPDDGRPTLGQALAAVISATTESMGYAQEDGGRSFQRLFPVPGVVNGGRTPGELYAHLDNPMLYTWAQPQVIHLACVCNYAQAATKFLTMDAVLRGLREGFGDSVVELLQRPSYVTAVSNSFLNGDLDKSVTTRARPVLYGKKAEGGPSHFNAKAFDIEVALDVADRDIYERALAAYVAVLKDRDDLAFTLTLQSRTAVSFNQVRNLHGRGAIGSEKYRELVRAYGRFDFDDLMAYLGSVPPYFVFDASALIDR